MSRECDIKFKVKQEYLMHMKDHEEVNQSGGKLANLIFTSQKDISNHVPSKNIVYQMIESLSNFDLC